MKHILIILSILLLSSPLFGQKTDVLFLRQENGVERWFKNGDEKKDMIYVREIVAESDDPIDVSK